VEGYLWLPDPPRLLKHADVRCGVAGLDRRYRAKMTSTPPLIGLDLAIDLREQVGGDAAQGVARLTGVLLKSTPSSN